LEFKDAEGKFEDYDPNWRFFRVVRWKPDISYDLSKPDSYETDVIRVDWAADKVKDLEGKIGELTGIELDRMVLLLRHENVFKAATCEYFNMNWRKPKKLRDCSKLEHGQTIFVEDNDPAGDFGKFKWKLEFDLEANKISVNVNNPITDEEGF